MIGQARLLPIVTLTVLGALVPQLMFAFGPLWLVALGAPAVLCGPYWAGLVSSTGFGGFLAGRLDPRPAGDATGVAVLLVATSVVATTSTYVLVVTLMQPATERLRDGFISRPHPSSTPRNHRCTSAGSSRVMRLARTG